ncbi:MAG: LptA/OstA family protein, partial [Myxococcota bacterium]|nr:LptA/OstA family protein [Myxococcota bacterium]
MIHARKIIAALPFRVVAAALAFVLRLAIATPGEAQTPTFDFGAREEPVEIRADLIEYRYSDDVYVAEGNVQVAQGDRTLTSNWATFSGRTRIGVASGDVVYREGSDLLTARFAQFGVDSLEGVVLGANLDLGERGLRVAAEELVRTGQDRYRLLNARFTACRCP